MFHTTPTKFYPVTPSQALERGLFAFYLVDQISQVFILGGIDCRGVGNRYQSHTLTWFYLVATLNSLILLGITWFVATLVAVILR